MCRIVHLDDSNYYPLLFKKVIKDNKYLYFDKIDEMMDVIRENDVVVLDFLLGSNEVRNGLDVAIEIKKRFGNLVKVIFFSAFLFKDSNHVKDIRKYSDGIINKGEINELSNLIEGLEK